MELASSKRTEYRWANCALRICQNLRAQIVNQKSQIGP